MEGPSHLCKDLYNQQEIKAIYKVDGNQSYNRAPTVSKNYTYQIKENVSTQEAPLHRSAQPISPLPPPHPEFNR